MMWPATSLPEVSRQTLHSGNRSRTPLTGDRAARVATLGGVIFGDAEIARIGLGTNRLTHTPANAAFIREAVRAGVGMIDTAHLYTRGQSEETIGAALGSDPDPGGCVVATKGGYDPGHGRPEVLEAEIEESLRRLRTDSIALYYLHRVDPQTPLEESLGAIKQYRDRGKIRHVGISEVSIDEIERARQVVPIAAVQNHYNLTERKYEPVVDYCARENIVFVPFFPLRGGGGRALAEIAARHGATPSQIKLAWLLRRSPAMLPIPGTLSLEHLEENIAALQIELTDADFEALL
ncbi:MAG: pyridoxine 4-dehydrogenase [Solirubrobacteraceae bacterium]|jgi:aryl-alcohol dehydrogenase-like predicted oxidoreductase|nr:pyridoxine 4-dehydrogenase [Solirubrobacteraceae bacterium]